MKHLALFFCLGVVLNVHAQKLSRDVLTTGGGSYSSDEISVDWTLGEIVAGYSSNEANSLSEGFQFSDRIIEDCRGNCYDLEGVVHAGSDLMQTGSVLLIDSLHNKCLTLDVKDGTFRFKQTYPGKYTFFAYPLGPAYDKYSPTYYVNKASLSTANYVQVKSSIKSVDIYLLEANTGTDLSDAAQIILYPNPASNYLNLIAGTTLNIAEITIFNSLGQQVYMQKNIGDCSSRIDISGLSSGLYTFVCTCSNRVIIKKFQKI
jgi:hypothetical protein